MGIYPSYFLGDALPVERVNWFDAIRYCNERSLQEGLTPVYTIDGETVRWNRNAQANGYRLPTEAEWEYAARAGTTGPFSTGETITTDQANFTRTVDTRYGPRGTRRDKTTPGGSFPANPWGLWDMQGNVIEWCWDWIGEYPAADTPLSDSNMTDPQGHSTGRSRVLRGGSWRSSDWAIRSAYRDGASPGGEKNNEIGFRVVRSFTE
jgi:formylglycine-generating enzyme required for sulfatase activity